MSIFITVDGQQIDVPTLSTARIVELYNQLAFELDEKPVTRFATRSKAEGRLIGIADRHRQQRGATKGTKGKTVKANEVFDNPTGWMNPGKPRPRDGVDAMLGLPKREEATPAPKPSPTPAPAAPAASGAPRWAKPKKEPAAKIAYKPRPGSSQAIMYDLLKEPIDIEQFCEKMKAAGIKDKTLHTPSSVWSCLRYLFVTSKGYGLSFDGQRIQLLIPADEREPNGHNK